jgi:hypothetical protein
MFLPPLGELEPAEFYPPTQKTTGSISNIHISELRSIFPCEMGISWHVIFITNNAFVKLFLRGEKQF